MGNSCTEPPVPPEMNHQQNYNKIQQVDIVKTKLKITRDKLDNLIRSYENQQMSISNQIESEKRKGLKNKKKVLYLLKQLKEYQTNLTNLRNRKNVIQKTIRDVEQQYVDQQMINILDETNRYMKNVNEQMERKNWKDVIQNAKNNPYNDPFSNQISQDPDVDNLYKKLQLQVQLKSSKQIPVVISYQQNNNNQNIQNGNINRQIKYVYS